MNNMDTRPEFREITFRQIEENYRHIALSVIVEKYGCGLYEASTLLKRTINALKRQFSEESQWKEKEFWKVFFNIADREMIHTSTAMSKNFGLTEATFNDLVSELEQGRETLYEQVFLTHFEDCVRYLMSTYKASAEDAYDASMDAMVEFCKRLKTRQISYGNLRFLFTRMAGQIYLKWIKRQKRQTALDDMDIQEAPLEIDDETYVFLSKAWDGLLDDCRNLLEAFYYTGDTLENLAQAMSRSSVAVRKQKQRCVEKLRSLYLQFSSPES